jgi:hypothetical protein
VHRRAQIRGGASRWCGYHEGSAQPQGEDWVERSLQSLLTGDAHRRHQSTTPRKINAATGRRGRRARRDRSEGPAPTSRTLPGQEPLPVGTFSVTGLGGLLTEAQGLTNKQGLTQP